MKQWIKRIVVALGILLLVGAAAFIWWGTHPLAAMPEAQNALQSDSQVQVSNNDWITFLSVENRMDVGVILYPGGHVDPVAYTPLARGIAAAGFPVIMPRMPLNLAVFDINAADEIMARYPEIETWVIGGHSLGGAMAAEYVSGHETAVRGLFLWASYSAENTDLSRFTNLKVLSIFGSEDGDVAGIHASRDRLPLDTSWVEMAGANHAQFGYYGEQPGDGTATISREAQQEIILENTLTFLNEIALLAQ